MKMYRITIACAWLAAGWWLMLSQNVQAQTLSSEKAVERLKQTGGYDSLTEAVKAARRADGQPDAPQGFGQSAKLTASDGAANDYFGSSVAVSGDTAIIGASADDVGTSAEQGSAYVFTRSGTIWTLQQKLTASDGAAGDSFGTSVAISGDTAIIGAVLGTSLNQGAAYVFTRSGTVWTQQAQLIASDGAVNDYFGLSVGIDNDTAIVGAYYDTITANRQGAAYIFTRSGAAWTQQQRLTASDATANDYLGYSVAISGDTAIAGAYGDTIGANAFQGSAYVFTRSGATWTQQQKLTATGGAAGDVFGTSVDVDGGTAIVGANGVDFGTNGDQGAAYIFTRSGAAWTQQQKLAANDGAAADLFGGSVALDGNTIIAGTIWNDSNQNSDQGAAYVFRNLSGNWTQDSFKVASDGAANDLFGNSVAISGNTAIVGARDDMVGSNGAQGSAYVFVRSGATWTQQQKLTAADGAQLDYFGWSVGIDGDTAIIGAFQDDVGGNTDQGSAYIFVRNGGIWTQQAQLNGTGGAAQDFFGQSVAIDGNTAIVGAYFDNVGANTYQGSAFIFTRSGTTWTQQAQLNHTGGAAFDNFGQSVGISGDTVIVGAFGDDVGANADQGSAYIFTRSGTVWTQQQRLNSIGGAANDLFGTSVGISGETVIVGGSAFDISTNTSSGAAYIFVRTGNVWTQQQQLAAIGGAANDFFGTSVAIDGDTAIVGARRDDVNANADQGSAFVFERSNGAWAQRQQLTVSGGAAGDQFGFSVSISGDKIVVGAPFSDASTSAPRGISSSEPDAPTASNQGAAVFFVNQPLAPTAAYVSISGRVTTPQEFGLANAFVTLTDMEGNAQTVVTGKFGSYRFTNVMPGETYILSVRSKRYTYAPQIVTPQEDLTNVNFTAQ